MNEYYENVTNEEIQVGDIVSTSAIYIAENGCAAAKESNYLRLRKVEPEDTNLWYSFAKEKPEEGQEIILLFWLKYSLTPRWVIEKRTYTVADTFSLDDYWQPFTPPADTGGFEEWWKREGVSKAMHFLPPPFDKEEKKENVPNYAEELAKAAYEAGCKEGQK